jgi:anti-sigma B factor antagonist
VPQGRYRLCSGISGEVAVGLQISARQSGDVTVLDLQGRVTIGRGNDLLGNELRELLEHGTRKLLINLIGVPQMDSSGISTVVRSFVSLQRVGGSLKLLHPVGHVREVLELTRLLHSIPTFDDEAAAVASFAPSAARTSSP